MIQKALEKKRNGEGGFTLIELLVVMVIIGLLAAIAIPLFLNQKEKARETALKSDLRNLATYAEAFYVTNNTYAGWDIADAKAEGFVDSSTLQAGETATDGAAASITTFCVDGTVGSATWSYKNDRPTQLDNVPCP